MRVRTRDGDGEPGIWSAGEPVESAAAKAQLFSAFFATAYTQHDGFTPFLPSKTPHRLSSAG